MDWRLLGNKFILCLACNAGAFEERNLFTLDLKDCMLKESGKTSCGKEFQSLETRGMKEQSNCFLRLALSSTVKQ